MKKIMILALMSLLFNFPNQLKASSPQLISYGTNLIDQISYYGEIDTFTFEGKAGDVILIRMRDETKVDAHIELYNPDGIQISTDWSDGGLAEIKNLILNSEGLFTLIAYDHNHNDIGSYGLSLHALHAAEYATEIPEFITFEDSLRTICGVNMYTFVGQAGDFIYAELRSAKEHFEGEFYIYNSQGEEVFQSVKNGQRAIVGPVSLGQDDSYTIAVMDKGGNDVDYYGFTLNILNRHEVIPTLECSESKSLSISKLTERKVFRVLAEPGEIHLIEARSNDLSIELGMEIYDEWGGRIFQEVKTNRLSHAYIGESSVQRSYLIVVFDEHGNDFGHCGLQVHSISSEACAETLGCEDYSSNLQINALAESKLYLIDGVGGQSIDISLTKGNANNEPHLRLFSKTGNLIAEAYDTDIADLSTQYFPFTDLFILLASDKNGNDFGDLTLEKQGSSFSVELDDCHTVYYGFEPFASTTLKTTSLEQNLIYQWSTGETSSSITVSPAEDTEYFLTVTNSAGCSIETSSFVEVQDVHCGNGNNIKVKICHVNNDGSTSQKCLSENGVWGHLDNGIGHENCYIGECGYISVCSGSSSVKNLEQSISTDNEIELRLSKSISSNAKLYPNPTSNSVRIEFVTEVERSKVSIYDINGKPIYSESIRYPRNGLEISMDNYGVLPGIYFVKIDSDTNTEVRKLFYVK